MIGGDNVGGGGDRVSSMLPTADSIEFVERAEELGMDDPQVWKAAMAQLPISLYPDEFMPEIPGSSLHFEPITLQTPVAMRELGIGACDFRLHACIDNADTGHVAIALDIVVRYLESIRKAAEGTGEGRGAVVKMAQRRV